MKLASTLLGGATLALAGAAFAQSIEDQTNPNLANPPLWDDLADLEVIRVGDTFYYTASTMAYSPGAPVLKSYDLANWEYIGHSVPELDFGPEYYLNTSSRGYVQGIWASSMRYRESDSHFYWIGCIVSTQNSYVYKAASPEGPWERWSEFETCYYDAGLLFDDNDDVYVAYGAYNISVAQLSFDVTEELSTTLVLESPDVYLEGSRFYNINGSYLIAVTRPADAEFILKADNPYGPYDMKTLVDAIAAPVDGAGAPHQGGLVDTQDGQWYYTAFIDNYPGGRTPVIAPVTWDEDGFPVIVADGDGGWAGSYAMPVITDKLALSPLGTDSFTGSSLGPEWEWNHNPDNSAWSLGSGGGRRRQVGLTLSTSSVTTDLFQARNTLTHRIRGPKSRGTFVVDVSSMADGDRAGMAWFRDRSAYVGVHKSGSTSRVVMVNGITMEQSDWSTADEGAVAEEGPTLSPWSTGSTVHLRVETDIRPAGSLIASFWYSLDGESYAQIGPDFEEDTDWHFFMGPRYSVFNFATVETGGSVLVKSFTQEAIE
ncbi:Glycoside hydrolase family 43 [Zalerion maritima]|uniref:Glycoside hydrolase family 43 n=1 Tax=Zalerion maritima TaxID=339359 RepID=A0AAD5RJ90_9PEZI|nr:Glycoside hydrolase family 43 [Zalerion maritima]